MRWWIRAGVLLFGIVIGFHKMPVLKVSSGDKDAKSIRYVALGDSIAHGYGLSNPDRDSYAGQIGKYLEERYEYVFFANLGTDGQRSEQLLDILTDPDNKSYEKYHATLHHADVVTLSIGSNDLMHLIRLDRNLKDYIEKGDQMFCEACGRFSDNFPRIIETIRSIAPEAQIFVNNVYNPCRGISGLENLNTLAEYYIGLLNQTFVTESGFTLVDIKKGFDSTGEDLLNMAISGREIDPHPNKDGHRVIGNMVIQRMMEKGVG